MHGSRDQLSRAGGRAISRAVFTKEHRKLNTDNSLSTQTTNYTDRKSRQEADCVSPRAER